MTDMTAAIAAKFDARTKAHAEANAFTPDPALESLGRKLDQLREDNPSEFEGAGLARARQTVTTYRRRKADHEENTK